MRSLTRLALAYLCAFLLAGCSVALPPSTPSSTGPSAPAASVRGPLSPLPVAFIANHGQLDPRVDYVVAGRGTNLYFTPQGVTVALTGPAVRNPDAELHAALGPDSDPETPDSTRRWAVAIDFVDANPAVHPRGHEPRAESVSYYKGRPDEWRLGVPTYSSLEYPELWPGIDLLYTGTDGRLKYTFLVQPGADPGQIQLAYRGATSVTLTPAGQLDVSTPLGGFVEEAPLVYQEINGQRVPVPSGYEVEARSPQHSLVQFRLGDYDPSLPLVIDPVVLVYAGFIGGSANDYGNRIAVDNAGNAYLVGSTDSSQATFPETVGPDLTYNGGDLPGSDAGGDAFVAKVRADGSGLVYAGYLGGSGSDTGLDIAVDPDGNAYVLGRTGSTNFPTTDLAYRRQPPGGGDAFVAKLDPNGTLLWATYLGGSSTETPGGIAIDGTRNVYVAGITSSNDFPTTPNGHQITRRGSEDAFLAKLSADGSQLLYGTYLGGDNDNTIIFGSVNAYVAVDPNGIAYVAGRTRSMGFPATAGAYQTGPRPLFIAKIDTVGAGLSAAAVGGLLAFTYFGGEAPVNAAGVTTARDELRDLAMDGAGNVYVTGSTVLMDFPTTAGVQQRFNGGKSAFKSTNGAASWTPIVNGLGTSDAVSNFAFSRQDPAMVYAVAVRGVFKSTDAAQSWAPVGPGLPASRPRALVVDPQNAANVYAGTDSGVYKSTNGGASWSLSSTGIPAGQTVEDLAIDPQSSSTIYAAAGGGVFTSTTSGASWTPMNTGLPGGARKLVIDPQTPSTLYAGAIPGGSIGGGAARPVAGVYKSTNGGASWDLVFGADMCTGLLFCGAAVVDLDIDPITPSTLYARLNRDIITMPGDSLYKSTNGGTSWGQIGTELPRGTPNGFFALDPQAPATLYYTHASTGIHKSTNGGATWSLSPSAGLSNPETTGLAVAPNGDVYLGTTPGGDAFVAKLDPNLTTLLYSTYLGGDSDDVGNGIAVAPTCTQACTAWVTGLTEAPNFPLGTNGVAALGLESTLGGTEDAFVAKLDAAGRVLTATYLGGDARDRGLGIAVDAGGAAYVAGRTTSANFPVAGSLGPTYGGTCLTFRGTTPTPTPTPHPCDDAFVAKLSDATATPSHTATSVATPTGTRTATPPPAATRTPTATPSRTPTVTRTATASPTRTNSPTVTVTPTATPLPPLGGKDLTLDVDGEVRVSWSNGRNQTGYVLLRWSPTSGFAFIPAPGSFLPASATSYPDPGPLDDDAYCYVLLVVTDSPPSFNGIAGISDLLCLYPDSGSSTGAPTLALTLHDGQIATLIWSGPGGQTRYRLRSMTFDADPPIERILGGTATTTTYDTLGKSTCFTLTALAGDQELGTSRTVCAVPGVSSLR